MRGQHGADLLAAGNDIEHARRQQAVAQFRETQRRERRLLRRFHHDGVAGGEGRRGFACAEHEGMVERNDTSDHAHRLAHREIHRIGPHRNGVALHLGDKAGEEIELRRRDHGVAHHFTHRIAAIGGIDHRKLAGIVAQHLCDALQDLRALERQHAPPFLEGRGCRSDSRFRVGRAAIGDFAKAFAGAGRDAFGIAAVFRLVPLPAVIGVAMLGQRQLLRNGGLRRDGGWSWHLLWIEIRQRDRGGTAAAGC